MMARRRAAFLEISRSVNWVSSFQIDGDLSVNELRQFYIGSGPGIRTLNLAVNRSLHPVQK
jgi:hypothetical protein